MQTSSGAVIETKSIKGSGIRRDNPSLGIVEAKFVPELQVKVTFSPDFLGVFAENTPKETPKPAPPAPAPADDPMDLFFWGFIF